MGSMPGRGVPRDGCFRGLVTGLNMRCASVVFYSFFQGRWKNADLPGLDSSIDWLRFHSVLPVVYPFDAPVCLQHLRPGREAWIQQDYC